jgi:5-methylcytosine-specific restriction endonuclease McrA
MSLLQSEKKREYNAKRLRDYMNIPENKAKHNELSKLYMRKARSRLGKEKIVFELSNLTFKTALEMKDVTLKKIADNIGIVIDQTHPEYPFFLDVFKRHPEKSDVMPCQFIFQGGKYRSPNMKTSPLTAKEKYRPFYRTTPDGKWDTFSVNKCFSQKERTQENKVFQALRYEIDDQIKIYRLQNPCCSECKNKTFKDLEVDHIIPFKELRDNWLSQHDIKKIDTEKEGVKILLSDSDLKKSWKEYHMENCSLQTLCKECHLAKTSSSL